MSKSSWPTYDDCVVISPMTVRACWLIWEEMRVRGEQPGSEDLWVFPLQRSDMVARVRMRWAKLTGHPAERFPYADHFVHGLFIKLRKTNSDLKPKRFAESVGRASVTDGVEL